MTQAGAPSVGQGVNRAGESMARCISDGVQDLGRGWDGGAGPASRTRSDIGSSKNIGHAQSEPDQVDDRVQDRAEDLGQDGAGTTKVIPLQFEVICSPQNVSALPKGRVCSITLFAPFDSHAFQLLHSLNGSFEPRGRRARHGHLRVDPLLGDVHAPSHTQGGPRQLLAPRSTQRDFQSGLGGGEGEE